MFKLPKKLTFNSVLFIIALALPILLSFLFSDIFHSNDIKEFKEWHTNSETFFNLYITKCRCNYPIIGLFSSTWILHLFQDNILFFKLYIATFEIASILLIFMILKHFNVTTPLFWAGLIGILPSSWAGGALWTQIDVIGQVFLLCGIIVMYLVLQEINIKKKILYHCLLGLIFSSLFLFKQLVYVSIIGLIIMYCTTILIELKKSIKNILPECLSIISGSFLILILEVFITKDVKFYSHLQHVLPDFTSVEHMDIISGNGFNFWVLLFEDFNTSSNIIVLFNLSPNTIGQFLFATLIIAVCIRMFLLIKHAYPSKVIFLYGIFSLAILNLGMNIVLTGTHERYLYYFYPYILIIALTLLKSNKIFLYQSILMGVIYGIFVLLVLLKLTNYQVFIILSIAHILFFIHIVYLFFKRP